MADAPEIKVESGKTENFQATPGDGDGWFENKEVDPLAATGTIVSQRPATTSAAPSSNPFTPAAPTSFQDAVQQQVISSVASSAWEQASGVSKYIPTIDSLRPYYDTHPSVVFKRMVYSVVPLRGSIDEFYATFDLYGPSMIALTLAAIILLAMKVNGTTIKEGTLVGAALSVSFGYWFGGSGLIYLVGKLCGTEIKAVEALAVVGYGMVGYCVTIFITMLLGGWFWWVALIVGGLSSARIALACYSRASGPRALFFAIFAGFVHFTFLIYLHLAYTSPSVAYAAAAAAATPIVVNPPSGEDGDSSVTSMANGPTTGTDGKFVTLPVGDRAPEIQ